MGEFLTIGYCLRTIGYCFSCCSLEIFVGDKALMEGIKSWWGDPPVPPLGLFFHALAALVKSMRII